MAMNLPTVINLHTTSHASDALARGQTGTPGVGTKTNGNFPLTTNAAQSVNNTASSQTGAIDINHWELHATGRDVSTNTQVLVGTWQYNAPNRIQMSDNANDGWVIQIGSGAASPPTDYKRFRIGGRDKTSGSAREVRHCVIDLNDTSNEASGGTFSNTDVETYGFGSVRQDMVGGSTHLAFLQRTWVFETTRGATNMPNFTGTSNWDDLVDLVNGSSYTTKISHGWAKREGNIYAVAAPMQFGDATVLTNFNDAGAVVFFPNTNTAADPVVRVTSQAFRVYSNLRNNAADTIILTGAYDVGDSTPDWDFNQSNSATITITNASFKNIGTFLIGSSVTGAATFDSCGLVDITNNGADLDGSIFKNGSGAHMLSLAA